MSHDFNMRQVFYVAMEGENERMKFIYSLFLLKGVGDDGLTQKTQNGSLNGTGISIAI